VSNATSVVMEKERKGRGTGSRKLTVVSAILIYVGSDAGSFDVKVLEPDVGHIAPVIVSAPERASGAERRSD